MARQAAAKTQGTTSSSLAAGWGELRPIAAICAWSTARGPGRASVIGEIEGCLAGIHEIRDRFLQ